MSDIDMKALLERARMAILRRDCRHMLVCGDAKCRAAGHEHEDYGEDGWSCDGEDCECRPACDGHGSETCAVTTEKRETVAALDEAICALASPEEAPPAPAPTTPLCPDCGGRGAVGWHPDSRLVCPKCRGTGLAPRPSDPAKAVDPIDAFHTHLDVCRQCKEHPRDLCTVGKPLLTAIGTRPR